MLPTALARNLASTFTEPNGLPPLGVLDPTEFPVLYVDDSADQRELMDIVFRNSGFPVFTTGDTKKIEAILRHHGIKLLFLDLDLATENGLEILLHLKSRPETASLPVIMLTADNSRESILECVRSGCDGYVVKPINESLITKAYEVLEKRYYSPELINGVVRHLNRGTVLVQENVRQSKLFLIQHGFVKVFLNRQGHEIPLATLSEGDILGEESFLTGAPAAASAVTTSKVTVLELEATQNLEDYWKTNFGLKEMFNGMARKLRKANDALALQSYSNYMVTRHRGADLQNEVLYAEVWRLLSLVRMIYAVEKKAEMSFQALGTKLEALSPGTLLPLDEFLGVLGKQSILYRKASAPADLPLFSLDMSFAGAMISKLEAAKHSGNYFILNEVTDNLLGLLDALHPERREDGTVLIVPTNIINASGAPQVRESLRTLAHLDIIAFVDREEKELRYAPLNLNFFLKWQRVLMSLSPSRTAAGSSPSKARKP